jgi:WD40 repeat protein
MGRMDALRARVRRPEPPLAAAISLVATGLVAAIVLGNTLASPGGSSPSPGASQPPASPSAPPATAPATQAPTTSAGAGLSLGAVPDSAGWKPVAWSPDGSTLLLRQADRWGVLDASGRMESVEAEAIAWWPGGDRTLSLVVRDPDGQVGLELRPMNGDEPTTLLRQPDITAVAWSPDGETVAIAAPTGVLVGSSRGPLSPVTATAASAVAISPDGSEVAYVVVGGAQAGSLVIADLAHKQTKTAGSVRMLARDALAWAPSGRFIALTQSASSRRGLYLLAPSVPQAPAFVLSGADPTSVRWSPDGRFLAASHPVDADSEVVSIRVRPDSARLETLGAGQVTAWSPDGQNLLTVDSTGRLLAYRMASEADSTGSLEPTASPRENATDADPSCPPAWSTLAVIAYCARNGDVVLTRA